MWIKIIFNFRNVTRLKIMYKLSTFNRTHIRHDRYYEDALSLISAAWLVARDLLKFYSKWHWTLIIISSQDIQLLRNSLILIYNWIIQRTGFENYQLEIQQKLYSPELAQKPSSQFPCWWRTVSPSTRGRATAGDPGYRLPYRYMGSQSSCIFPLKLSTPPRWLVDPSLICDGTIKVLADSWWGIAQSSHADPWKWLIPSEC